MAVKRVPTGVAGFDELVGGGFPAGSAIALIGTPGSGKTIFSLQYLVQGAQKGERGLYVSFKQSVDSLRAQGEQFGWRMPYLEAGGLKLLKVDGFDLIQVILDIEKEVRIFKPRRIVIDSMTDLLDYLPTAENMKKLGVVKKIGKSSVLFISPHDTVNRLASVFIERMRRTGATTIFVTDAPQQGDNLTKDGVTEFACDGVIQLHAVPGDDSFNTLNVLKMRLTNPKRGIYNFEFTEKGLRIRPG